MIRAIKSAVTAYHVTAEDNVRGNSSANPAAARMSGRTPHGPIGRNSSSTAVSRKINSIPTSVRRWLSIDRNCQAAKTMLVRSEWLIGEFDFPHLHTNRGGLAPIAQFSRAGGFAKSSEEALRRKELRANGIELERVGDVQLLGSSRRINKQSNIAEGGAVGRGEHSESAAFPWTEVGDLHEHDLGDRHA